MGEEGKKGEMSEESRVFGTTCGLNLFVVRI